VGPDVAGGEAGGQVDWRMEAGKTVHQFLGAGHEIFPEEPGWTVGNRSARIWVGTKIFSGPRRFPGVYAHVYIGPDLALDTPKYQFYKKMKFLLDLVATFPKKSTFP
jgi:hypothetical protein